MSGSIGTNMSNWDVRSPGHEGAGVVAQVGPQVQNWSVGDRAGIKPVWDACFDCDLCWSGREMHCKKACPTGLRVTGMSVPYITNTKKYWSFS